MLLTNQIYSKRSGNPNKYSHIYILQIHLINEWGFNYERINGTLKSK